MPRTNPLFGSFFFGGFECSTQLTNEGRRLDLIAATQHDVMAREDYALCKAAGLNAVREAARWPIIDRAGSLDLSSVAAFARAGREVGVTQLWDLMHYGYPDDLDPFSPQFTARFAAYARAVAEVIKEERGEGAWYTPVNEISYTAWAAGDVGYMAPFAHGNGGGYKRALVRAAIAATNAIWEVDPQARILTVDPLVLQHAPKSRPDLQSQADFFNSHIVTEAFDMLCGRLEPELGGSRRHLGVVGVNYYAANQWTIPTPELPQRFLNWHDPEWVPVSDLLLRLHERYGGPIVIAETGSSGEGRVPWLNYLAGEVRVALERGAEVGGVCLYPVITSPDWEDPTAFFDGGLFDVEPQADGKLVRVLAIPVAAALREAQLALDPHNALTVPLPSGVGVLSQAAQFGVARPLERVTFKSDNFSYQTLLASDALLVEVYGFGPGGNLPPHKYATIEHVLTVLMGEGFIHVGGCAVHLRVGESVLVTANVYYSIENITPGRFVVQQVSTPKPWDARYTGPHPNDLGQSR